MVIHFHMKMIFEVQQDSAIKSIIDTLIAVQK